MGTQVFLDKYDTFARLEVTDSCSKRHRVLELEDHEYDYSVRRAHKNDAGNIFFVSNEIHNWLCERCGTNYVREVTLELAVSPAHVNPWDETQMGFMLVFTDPNVAMMFKLAFGGE
jgi:hypothetical protein